LKEIRGKSALDLAVESGNHSSLSYLIKLCEDGGVPISDEKRLNLLVLAIQLNQAHVVRNLIKDIDNELINTIDLSTLQVKNTNLSILNDLRNNGYSFSSTAQAIINKKEHFNLTYLESISCFIVVLFDYLLEMTKINKGADVNKHRLFNTMESRKAASCSMDSSSIDEPIEVIDFNAFFAENDETPQPILV
jgi:hypothetical protein